MIKRNLILFILFLLCTRTGFSQNPLEIFGYFESQIMGTVIKKNFYQLHTNKLRVDLKSDLSDAISFGANFDYITYHGRKNWDILEFLPDNIISEIQDNVKSFYMLPFEDRIFLDNAYLKIAFNQFDLTLGKQQISLGTGYVWNPVDVFNIKDPLDPTYEQPGHNAIRLDMQLGKGYILSALYSAEDNWENSAKLIRLKGRLSHFDYSFIAIEKLWQFHDYTEFNTATYNFTTHPERQRLFGFSTAGELLGMGAWTEYAYNDMQITKNFHSLVVGTDYTFDFQTYVMIEYFRNTLGKTDENEYTLNDWMRLITSEQKAISRDQLYLLMQHPVTDFTEMGLSCIYSISDQSIALVPTFNYSLSSNVEIMGYININIGKSRTVYFSEQGHGGLLRARVYF